MISVVDETKLASRHQAKLGSIFGFSMLMIKACFSVFLFMWIRWTIPRFHFDQLMHQAEGFSAIGITQYTDNSSCCIMVEQIGEGF